MPLLPPVMTAIFPVNLFDDIIFPSLLDTLVRNCAQNRTLYPFHFYCFLSPSIAMVAIDLSSSGDAPALALTLMPVVTDRRYRAAAVESSEERTSFLLFASRLTFS